MRQAELAEKQRVKRRQEDANLIMNPDKWPCWPVLPVKRYRGHGMPECGYIYYDREQNDKSYEGRVIVRVGDIYNAKREDPKTEYASITEFQDAGWLVG